MLRERYENDVRQEVLAQRIVGREIRNQVEVTTDEVQKYFNEHQDELPQRADEVQLAHIVAYPVDPEKDRAAQERMVAARARIMGGESFETVAQATSDDLTKIRGGELGWFTPGDLDGDFQAAVDTLELNQLSAPVRSRYGYHLIEVEERDGARFRVRHILARVEATEADVLAAQERVIGAYERLMAGESFADVAKEIERRPAHPRSGRRAGVDAHAGALARGGGDDRQRGGEQHQPRGAVGPRFPRVQDHESPGRRVL